MSSGDVFPMLSDFHNRAIDRVDFVLIDRGTVSQALSFVTRCEACAPDAEIPFDILNASAFQGTGGPEGARECRMGRNRLCLLRAGYAVRYDRGLRTNADTRRGVPQG